jgi:hypothetical protein
VFELRIAALPQRTVDTDREYRYNERPMDSMRFPWDSSNKKANELTLSMFGTAEEVAEMAKPIRVVNTRRGAREALEAIITNNGTENVSARELTSRSGLSAYLRRSSIGKLVSAIQTKNMPVEALWLATANIDKLYSNAIEPWKFELNPNKSNDGLKDRFILYAPLEYKNHIIPVKITVKEYRDPQVPKKIYSVETVDVVINA